MVGIYIHIPFCRKACHYCNFHFSTSGRHTSEMVDAICAEAFIRKDYINEAVTTIYFGGGTPSILSIAAIEKILQSLRSLFIIKDNAEITLEANPDDIEAEKLAAWKAVGINRLSIGIQSFFEEDLLWMNRAHNAQQAMQSLQLAQQAGFDNITIDLIYGTPTLTDERWKQNVDTALSLQIPHLSCYALTVESKTALEKMILQHKIENVDPEKQSRHFELLIEWLNNADYEHYEISNFSKPGHHSRHNTSYWQGKSYLGLGPAAHSFNGSSRQWNVANNAFYIKSILEQKNVPFEIEELTEVQQLNEYLMTRLRTMEGISLQHIAAYGNEKWLNEILHDGQKWVETEHLVLQNNYLRLTNKGKLFADGIAASLFREG